jgi:D-sedoheptulose 7-phosphate isomerase
MSKSIISNNFNEAQKILSDFINDADNLNKIEAAGNLLVEAFKNEHKVVSCGNGGSMCDAMHFAEELTGRFRDDRPALPAISISDASHMSCVGNDYGYDDVFSRYLSAVGQKGDVLLAISTSGNSKNVINAIQIAKNKGIKVIGLTGKSGGEMANLCDVEIRAPFSEYADRAQEIHIKVIHSLIHYVESVMFS